MINFLSSWAKNLGVTIVIISILEMLLPNNKTKKYIRMVMGIYILFIIISPFIKNKDIFNYEEFDFDRYKSLETNADVKIDQTSMDKRIQSLYKEELEKDITKKLTGKGFEVIKCKVEVQINNEKDESKITKIELNLQKNDKKLEDENNKEENKDIEDKMIKEIQKIKPIDTSSNKAIDINKQSKKENNNKITKLDIQNIKKFLIEEYEVDEKCLEIN